MSSFTAVILAAGMGTRMRSDMPKVLHKVCGRELCRWVIGAAKAAGAETTVAVIGHKAELVREKLDGECNFAVQSEQLGTGHAVMQAEEFIKAAAGGNVVILNGDTPLITADTIKKAIEAHEASGNKATVITAELDDATGYGRIVRDSSGGVVKIVEHKDATDKERAIKEINSGMYVFSAESLLFALGRLTPNNAQGEYYLTDTIEILLSNGDKVGAYVIDDNDEIRGINDRVQLAEAETIMRDRLRRIHMKNGVTIPNPQSVYIEADVEIGGDTVIYDGAMIMAGTRIGKNCTIMGASQLTNAVIGDNVDINNSVIKDSTVNSGTTVGPFAYIRPNCVVGENVKVGDFVELKNSTIGSNTKISHLTYVGDSDVGENVNFGCGTVTVNYDGSKKYRCTIGDNAFIGCNTNLVAPVTVKEGAYTAAGSTITDEVPENALAIARARQVNKTDWHRK